MILPIIKAQYFIPTNAHGIVTNNGISAVVNRTQNSFLKSNAFCILALNIPAKLYIGRITPEIDIARHKSGLPKKQESGFEKNTSNIHNTIEKDKFVQKATSKHSCISSSVFVSCCIKNFLKPDSINISQNEIIINIVVNGAKSSGCNKRAKIAFNNGVTNLTDTSVMADHLKEFPISV